MRRLNFRRDTGKGFPSCEGRRDGVLVLQSCINGAAGLLGSVQVCIFFINLPTLSPVKIGTGLRY